MQDTLTLERGLVQQGSISKGCTSVGLDPNTCLTTMSSLIGSGPYQGLNKEPVEHLLRKLSKKLLTLKRIGYLSEAVYNKISPLQNRHLDSRVFQRFLELMYL